MPRAFAPAPPPHLRFQEWTAAGVFLELWRVGLEHYDEVKGLDWSWLSMDGAITKSPLGGLTGVCIGCSKLKPRWDVHLSGDDDQLGLSP